MTYAQRQRLAYIDHRLLTVGSIRREHIAERFGVSVSQASSDLGAFLEQHPDAIRYDGTAKQYVPANGLYRSVTGWTPRKLAAWAVAAEAGVEWAWD